MQLDQRSRDAAMRRANGPSGNFFRVIWEFFRSITVSFALFLVVRFFFLEAFTIPSGSMERTLLVGDFLIVNKLLYGAEIPLTAARLPGVRRPHTGDVIVFQWPKDLEQSFVKRVVAEGGDTVAMHDGVLYLNGKPRREGYVVHADPDDDPMYESFRWQARYLADTMLRPGYHPTRNNWGPLVVPRGSYFVLGDNRDNSLDSRFWGFVADSLVRGKPLFVYFSVAPDRTGVASSWTQRFRWRRVGTMVH
jgi:signal peptidase I